MRTPDEPFQPKRSSIVDFVTNMELSTINEKNNSSDPSKELLDKQKTLETPLLKAKKSILGFGSNGSLQGILKNRDSKGRSYSMPFIKNTSSVNRSETDKIFIGKMTMVLSGLYCKTLVVLGMCFPIAEVLSAHVPSSFYEAFYFYLYVGSIKFLMFIYVSLMNERRRKKITVLKRLDKTKVNEQGHIKSGHTNSRYGSFYLRLGAAAFGVGSMIYAGLEFGQYFELVNNVKCSSVLMAVTPALRMAFIVFQLQFIFVSDNQKTLRNYKTVSRFGLMHLIATNLCVWLNILVQETKHEILNFYNPNTSTAYLTKQFAMPLTYWPKKEIKPESLVIDSGDYVNLTASWFDPTNGARIKRGLRRPQELYECRRANIMGSLVQNAAPFLFPCTIEYSLICAVILYALWKNVCHTNEKKAKSSGGFVNRVLKPVTSYTSQYFTVDCANAHKGLFASILVMVYTIISLIMFFALIKFEEYASTAVFQVNLCELTLYVLGTLASIFAMYKIKDLKYENNRHMELDNILLVMAQTGLYMYFMFSLIAGFFTKEFFRKPNICITSVFGIIQSSVQTLFIIDAWWRRCNTAASMREKPARQLVTFLLVANIAMWAINHLENARADFHPIELKFYGVWAWTIITHVSMPLAVFYRFHSTVCLCEIWKCTYKMRLQSYCKNTEVVAV